MLAAGRGVRMGGRRPKALIPLGRHEPTLAYLLRGVRRAGVDDVLVVTGFGASEVQDYVASNFGDLDVTYVFNARYASWGNFHSLRIAVDQVPADDLLAVNCDVIVHPDLFRRVLSTEGDLVLAVERRLRLDEEDMRVHLSDDRVLGIGKDLPRARSHGEFCGVSLLRREARRRYADVATEVEWRAETSIYYEDIYARILDSLDVRAAFLSAGEYAEVDEPGDVVAAKAVIERYSSEWATEPAGEPAR